jgi:hypothetical protein
MERSEIRGGIDASRQSRFTLRSIRAALAGAACIGLDQFVGFDGWRRASASFIHSAAISR